MPSSSLSLLSLFLCCLITISKGDFNKDTEILFGDERAKILDRGKLLNLTIDKSCGSGFESRKKYMFGRFEVDMKLIPGNSAGTVTSFYLQSPGKTQDEIDIEFLGNSTGNPYTLHTNVYTRGQGNKEIGFALWFDPTKDFHRYTIIWSPLRIIWKVDYKPIRVYNNMENKGFQFPNKIPMRVYGTIWNSDDWATQGGKAKADWSNGPLTASYRNIHLTTARSSYLHQELDANGRNFLRWVEKKYMIYNKYCPDLSKEECRNRF